ncbi:MAG: SDR family oxidoreductase [Candidatus Eiseniibacteriota bacterium]
MILVVGATGLVGGRTARALLQRGQKVRALVRGGAGRAEGAALRAAGAEVVDGDLARPDTLAAACAGIHAVVCTATSFPRAAEEGLRTVDLEGVLALIEAAERASVKRFVYTSFSDTLPTPSPLNHAKRTCERRLRESPMAAVILRPTAFAEIWFTPIVGFDPASGRVRVYGTGEKATSYMSALDVAEIAAEAATRDEPGATYELGGPEALSLREVVRRYERARGVTLEVDAVPLAALEEGCRTAVGPTQETFAALLLGAAGGSVIPDAKKNAEHFGVRLRRVEDVLGIS